jgi:hypothetical protein
MLGIGCVGQADSPRVGGYHVYHGILHAHSGISDGKGSQAEAYEHARDHGKLDFFGLADHDYYPDDMTDADWTEIRNPPSASTTTGPSSPSGVSSGPATARCGRRAGWHRAT